MTGMDEFPDCSSKVQRAVEALQRGCEGMAAFTDMDDAWEETETDRVIREAARARQRIVKITVTAEHADGTVSEVLVNEPDTVGFSRRLPEYGPVCGDEPGITALLRARLASEPTELTVTIRTGVAGWSGTIRPPERA